LMELALSKVSLTLQPGNKTLSEEEVKQAALKYLAMNRERVRLEKRYNYQMINAMRMLPIIDANELGNKQVIVDWTEKMQQILTASKEDGAIYITEVFESGSKEYGIKIIVDTHGSVAINLIPPDFFRSREYERFVALDNLFDSTSIELAKGDKQEQFNNLKQAFDWLLNEVSQGLHLQRYKGLGEMNPDQLWETTMDDKTRIMYQVVIEDAVAADEIFTTLMGDQVDPRREFIEKNARSVENLDT